MSTNYYAKRIPTIEDYNEIVDKIKNNPISEAIKYIENQEETIHIGQYAVGWKFLFKWNENLYKSYSELVEFLKICTITSEYGNDTTLEEFKSMVENTQSNKSRFDIKSKTHITVDNYEFMDSYFC